MGCDAPDGNAMYEPMNNEIIFPAAIPQSPFYDSEYTDGANWGRIGYVVEESELGEEERIMLLMIASTPCKVF